MDLNRKPRCKHKASGSRILPLYMVLHVAKTLFGVLFTEKLALLEGRSQSARINGDAGRDLLEIDVKTREVAPRLFRVHDKLGWRWCWELESKNPSVIGWGATKGAGSLVWYAPSQLWVGNLARVGGEHLRYFR